MSRSPVGGDITRMGRGSGLNLGGAVCNQVALFVIISLLAGTGQREVGRYASCFALLSLLGLMCLAGFRAGLTRFVAMHVADADPQRLRGTLRIGLGLTLASSLVIGSALAVLAPVVASRLNDPDLTSGIRLVALALPAVTMSDAALAATQGWRTQRPFTLIGRVFEPLARLGLTAAAVGLGLGLVGAMWALVIGAWAAAGLSLLAVHRRLRSTPRVSAVYEVRQLLSFSTVSWASALAATGLIWVDTLLLGALRDQDTVGSYNVATRLVTLAVFVMPPINAAFSPHMAHLHHTGQQDAAASAYGSASRWILSLSMPAFILLVVYPRELLSYFGPGFAQAAAVTVILAFGQLINAAAGPCGTVLNMSGRVRLNMVDNVSVLLLNIGLNLALIPRYGMVGAAISWSASLVTVNVVKVLQARFVVGIRARQARLGRVVLASLPAAGTAVLMTTWVHGWVGVVGLAAPVVALAYVVVLWALGLAAEDKALLASLLRGREVRSRSARPTQQVLP